MITAPFARCIAKISGDGYLCRKYIRYANKCSVLREEFIKDIHAEFGDIKIYEAIGNSGTPFVQIHGRKIIDRFLEQLSDYRSSAIYIPNSIMESDNDVRIQYLRALYDDEGYVGIRIFKKTNEWKRNISLTSNSYEVLEDASSILSLLDIKANKIIPSHFGSLRCKSYVLSISGKENIKKFSRQIGFLHPDKIAKLNIMLESFHATSKNAKEFKRIKRSLRSHLKKKV